MIKNYLDDMCDDYVDMGGSGLESIRLELTKHLVRFEGRMCWQTVLKKSYASTGEYVHFRFISNEKDPSEGFKILVTAFRDGIAIACVLTFIIIVTIIACCCCFRGRWRNTGNSKQSVYETSDIYVTPTPEDLYSELQYHKAASLPRSLPPPPLPTIQVDSVPPYTEQVQTVHAYEPYHVKMIGPEMTHERHVWITAPPETTRVSRYSDE
ncbi:hypothetical protein MAR_026350 [Mya arenaria]|uniref:Uncharacterized protein n=1 Tax=Mya arenaria TaxID=6604 RepID=A0ABY7EQA4_MYAAR|nr:hypothetical protein MAR_026350 [Mya arenaria]